MGMDYNFKKINYSYFLFSFKFSSFQKKKRKEKKRKEKKKKRKPNGWLASHIGRWNTSWWTPEAFRGWSEQLGVPFFKKKNIYIFVFILL